MAREDCRSAQALQMLCIPVARCPLAPFPNCLSKSIELCTGLQGVVVGRRDGTSFPSLLKGRGGLESHGGPGRGSPEPQQ